MSYTYQRERAVKAASLWLTVRRNPGIDTTTLCAAFDWSDRTLSRLTRELARAARPLDRQRPTRGDVSHWYPDLTPTPLHDEVGPVLVHWLRLLERGKIDLTGASEEDKLVWYRDIPSLMLVGSPPFTPIDYVDARLEGAILTVTVPRSLTSKRQDIPVYKEPAHGS